LTLYKKVGSRFVQAKPADIYAEVGRLSAARRKRSGPASTLTGEQKAEIQRRAKDEKQADIAADFGISPSLVSRIVNRSR
jgi:hypothetical protein